MAARVSRIISIGPALGELRGAGPKNRLRGAGPKNRLRGGAEEQTAGVQNA